MRFSRRWEWSRTEEGLLDLVVRRSLVTCTRPESWGESANAPAREINK